MTASVLPDRVIDRNPSATNGLKTGKVAWGVDESEGLNIGFAPAGDGRVHVFLFWHQT